MKIYTRTGDDGQTSLFGGRRVSKSHPRVEAYGAVDELNSALGLAIAWCDDDPLRHRLLGMQSRLFDIGADLATPEGGAAGAWVPRVEESWVAALEVEIDEMAEQLPALRHFILPGGTPTAAALHVARTACRRAERRMTVAAEAGEDLGPHVLAYMNRVSDWLFMAARLANARAGVEDIPWRRGDANDSASDAI